MNTQKQHTTIEPPAGITTPKQPHKKSGWRSVLRSILTIAFVVGIFWLGVNIGNGTLSMSRFSSTTNNQNLPANLDYSEVEVLYDQLRKHFDGDLTVDELIDGLKKGLINASGDAYTEYMNAQEAAEFNSQLTGSFEGIGAVLGKNDDNQVVIISPISGFPAEKAGLRTNDVIRTIDGKSAEGFTTDQAVSRIRGEKGTKVTLGITRGAAEQLEITIVRDTITIPSVKYEIKDGNIGYIQINQFRTDTADLTRQAANYFRGAGVKSVVLDLRGNPGGSLDAAVDTASIWLSSGATILQEKRDGKVVETFTATGNPVLKGVPTVVLIDEGSASASEILAGALRDNKAASLLGTKSYGKGSVQRVINLQNGGILKVTIARWHLPSGANIDGEGITPDTVVERTDADYESGADPQLDAALAKLR